MKDPHKTTIYEPFKWTKKEILDEIEKTKTNIRLEKMRLDCLKEKLKQFIQDLESNTTKEK